MQVKDFSGYYEGYDNTKVPLNALTFPSSNCITKHGTVLSRKGYVDFGNNHQTWLSPVHSQFVWNNSFLRQDIILRAFTTNIGGENSKCYLEMNYNGTWTTIYSDFKPDASKISFATVNDWIVTNATAVLTDPTGTVKPVTLFENMMLVMADGSNKLYTWRAAVGVVDHMNGSNIFFTPTHASSVFDRGFSPTIMPTVGDEEVTNRPPQPLLVIRDGLVIYGGDDTPLVYTDATVDKQGLILTIPPGVNIQQGDVIIDKPQYFYNMPSNITSEPTPEQFITYTKPIDNVLYFSASRQLSVSGLDTPSDRLAHGIFNPVNEWQGFNFVVRPESSQYESTPTSINALGNITGMVEKKGGYLFISTANGWQTVYYNTNPEIAGNDRYEVYDYTNGSYKGAISQEGITTVNGDIVYITRDNTVETISTTNMVDNPVNTVLSEPVEWYFKKNDMSNSKIYYYDRYIYVILPVVGEFIMYDVIEKVWQPPQRISLSCLSYYNGNLIGHSGSIVSSYILDRGSTDLGAPFTVTIAGPYFQHPKAPFRYWDYPHLGISGRIGYGTQVLVEQFAEYEGKKSKFGFEFNGANENITFQDSSQEDYSWGNHPFGSKPWGGFLEKEEIAATTDQYAGVRRFWVFSKEKPTPSFEFRVIITLTGDASKFLLLAWNIEENIATREIDKPLFINKR